MTEPVPELVTLHLWRVPSRLVPAAVTRMALDRRPVRRTPGLRFAKLLGTGTGATFTPRDANLHRWGLLACWADPASAAAFEQSATARRWSGLAEESWRVALHPLAARGLWSRRQPFGSPTRRPWDGPVAALTRARIAVRATRRFWRSVPPVSADLAGRPGLRLAIGVGEAPIGLQGTFSVWDSSYALREFAYGRQPHQDVVRRTGCEGWYAEELFARFGVLYATGTVEGRNPLA